MKNKQEDQSINIEKNAWKLVKVEERVYKPILDQPKEIFLNFKDGFYNTSNGCNELNGEYKILNDNIEFLNGRTTLKMCSEEIMGNLYRVPFHKVKKINIKNNHLYLLSEDGKTIFAEFIKK